MRILFFSLSLSIASVAAAADWPQFMGPGGKGITESKQLPATWSDTENIVWKTPMPGIGASSPVVIGNKIFLTAGTGGADNLVRHVMCLDAAAGNVIWDKTVESELPEQGKIREDHGYCSATPVATATRLFVFFGKSGVFCFDHAGKQLWNTKVGSELNGWGSAASLTLHKNLVLVNASVESESLVALDAATGKEVWKADEVKESWHAPVLAPGKGGTTEVITAQQGQVRSFDADTGKELWKCKTGIGWYMCPLPVVKDGVLYAVGGRSGVGGLAVKTGGSGEVTETHRLWTLQKGTNVPSPIIHGDHLYFAHENLAIVHCVDLKTGEFVYSERLDPNPGQIYASPILAGGKLYYTGRGGQTVVVAAEPKFKVLSSAKLENGRGVFNASPAVHGDRLLLRSNKFLYCIGSK
jgi:outer membrane protein assembly factor BamB